MSSFWYPEEEENSSCDDSDDDDARNEEEQDDGELQNVDPHEVDRIGDLEEKYERYQEKEILSNKNKKRRRLNYVEIEDV